MNLKSLLKILKLNESTISMVLGALVIVVVGLLVINYFRNETGNTFPEAITDTTTLPTTHTVASGETLWSISEDYYGTGYNWTDIVEANDLVDASSIEEGQSLDIPLVESKLVEASPEPTTEPVETNKTYTVVRGDTLWSIAADIYGDGHRWLDIAKANHLQNPQVIHAGNVFILPN